MAKKKSKKSSRQKELEERLELAMQELLDSQSNPDRCLQNERATLIADSKQWRLRALLLQEEGKFAAAHQASKTADGLMTTAAALERASLGDRVLELESKLRRSRSRSDSLGDLEEVD